MKDVEHIRILVVLSVDKHTVNIIDRATIKESKDDFTKKIETEFEETDAVVVKAEFYKEEDCPYPPKKMKRIIAKYDYV